MTLAFCTASKLAADYEQLIQARMNSSMSMCVGREGGRGHLSGEYHCAFGASLNHDQTLRHRGKTCACQYADHSPPRPLRARVCARSWLKKVDLPLLNGKSTSAAWCRAELLR